MAANPYGWKHSVLYLMPTGVITLIWLFPLLLSMPFFLYYHPPMSLSRASLSLVTSTPMVWPAERPGPPKRSGPSSFTTFMFMVQYGAPLSFSLICYSKTVTCLHRRSEKENSTRETESQLIENKGINTMLISTVVTLGDCGLPLNTLCVIFD